MDKRLEQMKAVVDGYNEDLENSIIIRYAVKNLLDEVEWHIARLNKHKVSAALLYVSTCNDLGIELKAEALHDVGYPCGKNVCNRCHPELKKIIGDSK